MLAINIDKEKCTGCGECEKVCPPKILYLNDGHCSVKNDIILECFTCQSCVVVCPSKAILISD